MLPIFHAEESDKENVVFRPKIIIQLAKKF